jgi:hypothetical protein
MVMVANDRPLQINVPIYSILCQTWQHFEIIVYHDGINDKVRAAIDKINDDRIRYFEQDPQVKCWGHKLRWLGSLAAQGEFICHTNDDNYYAPTYFEKMLWRLQRSNSELVFCNMIHSHRDWAPFETAPQNGGLDAGSWMCKASVVKDTPWPEKLHFSSDGEYFDLLKEKARNTVKVDNYLFVHN